MDEKELQKITAFDTLFTTNQIQMLKILLTYLPPSSRKGLAIYIKYLELRYTVSFFERNPLADLGQSDRAENPDILQIMEEILPLCSPQEKEKIQQFRSMYQNYESMQEMMQFAQMMQEMSPDGQTDLSQLLNLFQTGV